jgi:polyhydroxyalkanoate synthesis regulator phasin
MAHDDVLKRYLDAGLAFTALTQARAEALVKDLVKAGEVQAEQARDAVTELLERSRKNSEQLLEMIRKEVREQVTKLGLVSQADMDKLEQRLASLFGGGAPAPTPKKKAAATKAPAKEKATAKKAPAKKKPAAKKSAPKA